ncbi:hypothetical protein K4A83_08805 [Spirulina subsalsa FACHB-351]|uniref:Uncharacterized protein n=1 Tax=Spirulina subsalsa FACHB-351 TaxID=234711 RepID=A0ABT3L4D8_9CYAN|nr:hypothetical protein [Spirulina subsalsa]MCW6036368.1 hypothetical protein [Spirulina subsalsa FACHB-351]
MLNPVQQNILVLAVYGIVLAFVFYQMWVDLDEFVSVKLDQEALKTDLERQNLQDLVEIESKFDDLYKPEQLKAIALTIKNKCPKETLFINWERSTLNDLKGESRRVIRMVPGMKVDLSQPQVFGLVAPGQTLKEKITAESCLKPKGDGSLELTKPLFKSDGLLKAAKKGDRVTLRLILEFSQPTVGVYNTSLHPISCQFKFSKTPLARAMYWEGKPRKNQKGK